MEVIYIANDNLIEVQKLWDVADMDETPIANADVFLSLEDYEGNIIQAPIPMVETSTMYKATLQDTLPLQLRMEYAIRIQATANSIQGTWIIPVVALHRQTIDCA